MPSPASKPVGTLDSKSPGKIVLRTTSNPSPVVPIPKSVTSGLRLDDKRLRDDLYDLQRATSEASNRHGELVDKHGELVDKIERLACSIDDLEKRLEDLVGIISTLTEKLTETLDKVT